MSGPAHHASRLVLENVGVDRGGRAVLEGVSLTVAPGEAVLVKGPNGAGKTSLLRAVAGLLPVSRGAARIEGNGALEGTDASARRVAIVFCGHADGVKAGESVRETLAFWARLYGAGEDAIAAALDGLDLAALADRRGAVLSAGQRRRLGLARAILSGKPIWLLDEPAASIDAASVERLQRLIESHCAHGGAALIATHDRLSINGARAVVVEPAS